VLEIARKHWNWLDGVLLPVAAALMHAAWFHPLLDLFLRDPVTGIRTPGLAFGLCLAVLATGLIVGRLAGPGWTGLVVALLGGMAVTALVLRWVIRVFWRQADLVSVLRTDQLATGPDRGLGWIPVLVALICLAFLWWRGVHLARVGCENLAQSFTLGVCILVGLLFLALLLPLSSQLESAKASGIHERYLLVYLAEGMAPLGLLIFGISTLATVLLIGFSFALGEVAADLMEWTVPVGLLSLALLSPDSLAPTGLLGPLLLFIASGLTALSLVRVSETLHAQESQAGIQLRVDRHWIAIAVGIMVIIVLVGVLSGRLLGPAFFELRRLVALLRWPTVNWPTGLSRPGQLSRAAPTTDVVGTSPGFEGFVQLVLLLGIALTIVTLFAKRRWLARLVAAVLGFPQPSTPDGVTERRESVFSWRLLWDQLRALMGGLHKRSPVSFFVELDPSGDPRGAIRQIYQDLLARAMALDLPRHKGETPAAYVRRLSWLCPHELSSLQLLTMAYTIARYGAAPPTAEDVRAARDAHARIALALRARAGTSRVVHAQAAAKGP
jgi:hypothetical protein